MTPLDPELRALLVCPRCRGDLDDVSRGLACRRCGVLYPIVEGVPYLIDACALPLVEADRR